MTRITTLTIRISVALKEFANGQAGEARPYGSASEYIRDLIRRDKELVEREAFVRLGNELRQSFSEPEASYQALTSAEVITRNRA
jgi:antitoxin ParD1/3/4